MSASRIFIGRKYDAGTRFPIPLTRKLFRPYSLLIVWIISEFSPNLVVCSIIMSVLTVIAAKLPLFSYFCRLEENGLK